MIALEIKPLRKQVRLNEVSRTEVLLRGGRDTAHTQRKDYIRTHEFMIN